MGRRGVLKVKVIGDRRDLDSTLDKSERKVKNFGSRLSGLGTVLGAIGIGAFAKEAVDAFNDSEHAAALMQNTIDRNPKLAGESVDAFNALAGAIQRKTAADDESVLSGAAVLGNFNLTGAQIREVLPLVVDYARKTGQDVPAAAQTIGKAFMGNAKALKNIGINYKATGDSGKDFATVTDLIRSKVGGFAEKEGKTAGGRLVILKNRLNDVQEIIGGKLVSAIDFVTRNFKIFGPILAGVITAMVVYKGAALATAAVNAIMGTSFTFALGPIGLVIAAIVAIGIALYVFRDKVRIALAWIVDKMLWFVGLFVHLAAAAFGWIPGIGPKLKKSAREFDQWRADVNRAIAGIKDRDIKVTVNGKNRVLFRTAALSDVVGRASGGPVSAGSPYVVGERGPELFVPGRSGTIVPNGAVASAGGVHIHVNGIIVGDKAEIGRFVADTLRAHKRRVGALGL